MCAFVRLSLVSAVCEPVTSMLLMVAVNFIAVCALLNWNLAVPNEAGRAAPVDVVGVVGGTSCPLVRLTTNNRTSPGVRFAVVSKASTYCALVKLDGYFAIKSGLVRKLLK